MKDKRTYTGFTYDISKRFKEHNRGLVTATKHRKPFKVIFVEKVGTIQKAKSRERYWKSGAGRRKLKQFFDKGCLPL